MSKVNCPNCGKFMNSEKECKHCHCFYGEHTVDDFEDLTEEDNEKFIFKEMCDSIETYLAMYGNPHMTIIADQKHIEVLQGVEAKEFKLLD